ncbi:MAG: DoxX family protein [Candidatus Sungbacteria bacterium]|nr:DoxX family protein [Candidatus Sungbacteria bacterium]
MTHFQKVSLFLLRVSLGWMMFYAGITKVLDPDWSAAGYLRGAKMFPSFYQGLLAPQILPIVNFANEWGLTLLGISLIFGIFVRLSSILGIVLMMLYYLPTLDFPYPNPHAYLVDEHIIYIFVLALFASMRAGRMWGLENWCSTLPICSKFPRIRNWLG